MDGSSAGTKTVIVADDTAFVRDRFRTALENAGHTAVALGTAADLVGYLRDKTTHVDLVVLDLRLPPGAGVELVRTVRRLERGNIPLLVFSGTIASAEEVRQLAALGVSGYVNEYSAVPHIMPSLAPHLFPDSFNRRGSPRVTLSVPVQYRFGSTIAAALTLNVGRGGAAIRTTSPLDRDAKVKVRLRMPGAAREVEADGRVAWSDTRVGMGIQFERVDPAGQTILDNFVDAHFFSNRKA